MCLSLSLCQQPPSSSSRRCKRSRNEPTVHKTTRRRFSFRYCLLLSCLLDLRNFSDLRCRSSLLLAAQAFTTDTTGSSSIGSNSASASSRLLHQTHRQRKQTTPPYILYNKSPPTVASSTTTSTSTSTSTALHFFFNNAEEAPKDLPLARYVDVSANYTLAHTPEDYIDLRENQRLVCIGDVHGDLEALKVYLETAGVYHRGTDSWCGGNTIVVQCGDVLDRGFEELACYRLLSKLSQQAPTQEGKIILLIGNHEALNAMGLFQYAFTDHEHERTIGKQVDEVLGLENLWRKQYANNQPARWASYEPGGLLAHSLMRNMKVAVRVGKTVCVHAGLKPHHLKDHGGIAKMNEAFREWISLGNDVGIDERYKQDQSTDPRQYYKPPLQNPVVYNHNGNYATPRQPWIDAEKRQQYYINTIPEFLQCKPDDPGPIWMRDYSSPHDALPNPVDSVKLEKDLDTTLTLLSADRMVMGHTIQQRVNGIFRGKAWRLDVGASKGCLGGTPEVLEVVCCRTNNSNSAGGGGGGESSSSSSFLAENVSVLVPSSPEPTRNGQPPLQQHQQHHPQQRQVRRIPAAERMVDAYTQAAVEML